MIANPPRITKSDIRECLKELGGNVPVPDRVEVVAEEDFEGDPVFRMTAVFPANVAAEDASWRKVNPLLGRLRALVSRKSGHELPVLAEIRRLADETGR